VTGPDGSFISFVPDTATRLSYGINHAAEAPIIGSQWFSWSPEDSEHYRWALAPAQTYAPSLEVCNAPAELRHIKDVEGLACCHAAVLSPLDGSLSQALTTMQKEGLLKGGSEGCSIVGYGNRWYTADRVRFFDDEPVRHKLLDLLVRLCSATSSSASTHSADPHRQHYCAAQGDLSLLAVGGNCGVPRGHVVAYQASHALHVEFAKALSTEQLLTHTS
jgi:UDP-3-O-[3-hydroxymyristoyl] N-acetylglucosamine deacetylase